MIFNSPAFVFFVAFGLLGYSMVPARARRYALLLLCAIWYGSWHESWLALFYGAAIANYGALRLGRRTGAAKNRFFYPGLVAANVVYLVLLKSDAPYGTSFFCFLMIAYVVDDWRRASQEPQGGLPDFLLYATFFPMLIAGPLERFERLSKQFGSLGPVSLENLSDGTMIFALGFLKKTLIAAPLSAPVDLLFNQPAPGVIRLVIGGLIATLQAYAEFSGYCDMGRGVARCFGIRLSLNFRPIYFTRNPNEFWQRWNLTLGTWIRDYVTLPALLRFGRKVNRYAIVLVAFLIVGLWHGIELHWALFGIFDGALIVAFLACQNGPLLRHARLLAATGLALTFCLYVGNGILWYPGSIPLLASLLRHPLSVGTLNDLGSLWPAARGAGASVWPGIPWMAVAVAALMGVDYFQERTGEPDFYLRIPRPARVAAATLLAGWLLVELRDGQFLTVADLPPLYFRL